MIDKILAISGKSGLFRLVARGNNNLIVESLTDGRRMPAHQRERVLSLGDIAMYTVDGEVPLNTVFAKAKALTGGTIAPVSVNDPAVEQLAWFAKVMPATSRSSSSGITSSLRQAMTISLNQRLLRLKLMQRLKKRHNRVFLLSSNKYSSTMQ